MEYCSGSDLSIYIKKRGKIPSLEYIPRGSVDGEKVFWPHPASGGLDERVTRHFLGQLGKLTSRIYHRQANQQPSHFVSFGVRISYIVISSLRSADSLSSL